MRPAPRDIDLDNTLEALIWLEDTASPEIQAAIHHADLHQTTYIFKSDPNCQTLLTGQIDGDSAHGQIANGQYTSDANGGSRSFKIVNGKLTQVK